MLTETVGYSTTPTIGYAPNQRALKPVTMAEIAIIVSFLIAIMTFYILIEASSLSIPPPS